AALGDVAADRLVLDEFAVWIKQPSMRPVLPNDAAIGRHGSMLVDDNGLLGREPRQLSTQVEFIILKGRVEKTLPHQVVGQCSAVTTVRVVDERARAIFAPTNDEFQVVLNDRTILFLALAKLFVDCAKLGSSFVNSPLQLLVSLAQGLLGMIPGRNVLAD